MKEPKLFEKSQIWLFFLLLMGVFASVGGVATHNTDMTLVGIVITSVAVGLAIIFYAFDQWNEKK